MSYRYSRAYTGSIQGVIFDWAGTLIDFGSFAPTQVLIEAFAGFGIEVSLAEARVPMGRAKWDHIKALGQLPQVAARWQEQFQRDMTDADVDAIYAKFMPLQIERVGAYSHPIEGAVELLAQLRSRNIKIGSCTGYPREVMATLTPIAVKQGIAVDNMVAADDLKPGGRPGPWMALANVIELGIGDVAACVKVDDTAVGIDEGLNAGMWTVGLTVSGNEVGLSSAEWAALTAEQQQEYRAIAERKLRQAGAHYVIDSVADLLPVLDLISAQMARGDRP